MTNIPDSALDAIVVGSGPNGLAAAITLARAGLAVRVYEGAPAAGGGLRSAELTLPGFVHDPCATVVATALVSPFFRTLDLAALGVELAHPEVAAAHVLEPDRGVLLHRSVEETAAGLGGTVPRGAGSSGRWPGTRISSCRGSWGRCRGRHGTS